MRFEKNSTAYYCRQASRGGGSGFYTIFFFTWTPFGSQDNPVPEHRQSNINCKWDWHGQAGASIHKRFPATRPANEGSRPMRYSNVTVFFVLAFCDSLTASSDLANRIPEDLLFSTNFYHVLSVFYLFPFNIRARKQWTTFSLNYTSICIYVYIYIIFLAICVVDFTVLLFACLFVVTIGY